jgi:hypothetical protein
VDVGLVMLLCNRQSVHPLTPHGLTLESIIIAIAQQHNDGKGPDPTTPTKATFSPHYPCPTPAVSVHVPELQKGCDDSTASWW